MLFTSDPAAPMITAATGSPPVPLVSLAREFAAGEVRAHAPAWDSGTAPPTDGLRAALEADLCTADWRIPDEDTDAVSMLGVFEALGWGCAGFAYALHAASLAARVIRTVGSPAQAEALLPLVTATSGEVRIGALAMSEPGAGSDVSAVATQATLDGDAYVLNGRKTFITNALEANAILVYATTDRSLGWTGIAPYVVPRDTPGLEITPVLQVLGLRAGRYADLQLTQCRIPVSHRLGVDGEAPSLRVLRALESSRAVVAAIAVGLAQAAYEYSVAHTRTREQFGHPLATQQSVAFTLADMATEIQAARLLTRHVGELADAGTPQRQGESSMAKCFATETAMRITTQTVQLLGSAGCTSAHPAEKWLRDAKLLEICEGPSAIQRLIVSRAILHV